MNLVKVLESSFIIIQHLFDILIKILKYVHAWFNNIMFVKVFKSYFIFLEDLFSCAQVLKCNTQKFIEHKPCVKVFHGFVINISFVKDMK
jgi:hypothetical protein